MDLLVAFVVILRLVV